MNLWVISSSYILHIFLILCIFTKYFAHSSSKWQQTEDVWICIETKIDKNIPEIQNDTGCAPKDYLHFMFYLYNDIIKYRLKKADTRLKDNDFPVFYLKEEKFYPINIDNVSQENGLVTHEVYKSKESTIALTCYSTADTQYKYQLLGVFQQNDSFWAILPLSAENRTDKSKSSFFLHKDMCYQHRIFKFSSGPFFNLSQQDYTRTKRSASSKEYILDLAFMIDSTVVDKFLTTMPNNWNINFPKVGFILKEYYSFLLNTINRSFQAFTTKDHVMKIKCHALIYSSKSQELNWANSKVNTVPDASAIMVKFSKWLKKFPDNKLLTADHIMMLTRYPFMHSSTFLNGFTWKSGLCTDERFSILHEEFNVGVALSAIQLIASNTGIEFDGSNNECDPEKGFIMSTDLSHNLKRYSLNIFQFSDCSKKKMQYLLRKSELIGKCLRNTSKIDLLDQFLLKKPGQRNPPNEQCMIYFGNTSNIYQCEKKNFDNRYYLCTEMFCPQAGVCKGILALEGTSCGAKMWCYNGRCRSHTNAPDISRNCWLGNKKISVNISNKIHQCRDIAYNKGRLCYNDEIRKQCCWSCSYFYTGEADCEYGDRVENCWSRECFFYDTKRAMHDCCSTCKFMQKTSSADCYFNICYTFCFLFQFIFHIFFNI